MGKRNAETGNRRKKSDKRREKHDRQGKFTKKGVRIFITTATRQKEGETGGETEITQLLLPIHFFNSERNRKLK